MTARPGGTIGVTPAHHVEPWANGFGVWHVRVPEGPSAAHIARKAIKDAINARQGEQITWLFLKRCPDLDLPGSVVYREDWTR